MNFEQLETFLQVMEAGSFTRAEAGSFLSKQAISLQMDRLEDEVGCQLLNRTRTGISPTVAGKVFLAGAKKLLSDREALISDCLEVSGENKLRIGGVEHQILLHKVTRAFTRTYPGIEVRRVAHLNHSGEWRVSNDIVDVAESFLVDSPTPFFPGLAFERLLDLPFRVAMRASHPLAGHSCLSLQDLTACQVCYFPTMVPAAYGEALEKAFAECPERLRKNLDNDKQLEAAFACAESDQLLVCANPFIETIRDLILVPLDTGWVRTYGVVYRPPMKYVVKKYLEVAHQVYGT